MHVQIAGEETMSGSASSEKADHIMKPFHGRSFFSYFLSVPEDLGNDHSHYNEGSQKKDPPSHTHNIQFIFHFIPAGNQPRGYACMSI